jgi:hypothetical protein
LLYWGYIVTFTKFLIIIIVKFTPSIIPRYPTPITGKASTGLIFHLHTCVHNISIIFTL